MADIWSCMLASISAMDASVGGAATGVEFTRAPVVVTNGRDTPEVGTMEEAGGIGGAKALVEAAEESICGEVSDTKLVWRLALLRTAYGGEWRG